MDDADFPEVVLHQIPFRSSTHLGDVDPEWFQEAIIDSATRLEAFGADRTVFACMTHDRTVQKIVETATSAEYLSITAEMHHALRNHSADKVLFLGSDRMRKDKRLKLPGKTIDHPDQITVNRLIRTSIAGRADESAFQDLVNPYPNHLIMLGCTELHLYRNTPVGQDILDSMSLLTERILR